MIRPSGTEPLADQSFSTIPTRLFGMYRTPNSSLTTTSPISPATRYRAPVIPAGVAWAKRGAISTTIAVNTMQLLGAETGSSP